MQYHVFMRMIALLLASGAGVCWAGVSSRAMYHQVIYVHNDSPTSVYVCFNEHACNPHWDMVPIHAQERKLLYVDAILERPVKKYYLSCTNSQAAADYTLEFDAYAQQIILKRNEYTVDTMGYAGGGQEARPYLVLNQSLDVRFYRSAEHDEDDGRGKCPRRPIKKIPPSQRERGRRCLKPTVEKTA